jgi:hypothetical protein
MTDLNLATERLHTATSSSGQQRPRQVMTLFGDGHEDGNSNFHDDALVEDHGDTSCYYQARTGTGYETQYKKYDYSCGNAYFRSGGNSFSGDELGPWRLPDSGQRCRGELGCD